MKKYLVKNTTNNEYYLLGSFQFMPRFYKAIGVWQTKGYNRERKWILEQANVIQQKINEAK